jgi:hypothetical protein
MPYIKQDARYELDDDTARMPETPGELNFVITSIINGYRNTQGLSYQTINDIVGALEGAKMEFYRRVAAPYEDTKMAENGDVYG